MRWGLLVLAAAAAAGGARAASGVTTDPNTASGQTFDYIVVGGGLTGITVAARLSENSSTSILLIEAGADNRNDPRVYDMYRYGDAFGSELDWQWKAEKGGIIGGKTLGGSSSINGATWTRGSIAQYNAWGALLESSESSLGWNWANMSYYMKRAESFSAPNDGQRAKGANSVASYHGTAGPVAVTFPDDMYGGSHQKFFQQTVTNLTGLPLSPDLNGGEPNCVSFVPNSINWHDSDHRSSSASAYLTPIEARRLKWLTLTTYQVTKILFSGTKAPVTATGVQFKKSDNTGSTFTAFARKEVIISAGAIQTPALLQLSGIGDPAHLSSLGITTVVNLPTVGKNLQEQTMSQLGASGNGNNPTGRGPNDMIAFPNLNQLFGSQASAARQTVSSSIASWANSQAANGLSAAALQTIMQTQANFILNNNAPLVEMFYQTGVPNDIGILMWQLLPFSRGVVKINSTNPFTKPTIKVNFFSVDFDLQVQVAGSRLARRVLTSPPLSTLSTGEKTPGSAVPGGNNATDAAWRSWIQQKFNTVSHPVGTAAMMRRGLGGVVDGRLRVYDTTNLRIADASVMPLQISAHLQSTLYGIGEKAAALIRANT
ncbi:glucose oxidase [Auricularia subglabra TFB-10046 SS5]|nr:glucose oxidase [Auricularia subglabra TFB-10046 SS5]